MLYWLRKQQDILLPPILFLFVCVLAYGIQAYYLGFYLDDWIVLDAYNINGAAGLQGYAYYDDRPLVFWIWWLGLELFHFTPIYWQLWAFLWRWLTVVMVWMICRSLWPKASKQVALSAMLFAIYPLFSQQATALSYSFHWICFFLWSLSVYLMVAAVRRPKRYPVLIIASVLAGAVQLFSQEYYIGLELLRPVILWIALRHNEHPWKQRARRVFLAWLPYIVILPVYFVWRAILMPSPGVDDNAPNFLYKLLSMPLETIPEFFVMVIQDVLHMLLGVWFATYEPKLVSLTPLSSVMAWGVAGIAALVTYMIFWWHQKQQSPINETDEGWYRTALPFGFLAMILGFLPGWMIGRHIYDLTGIYNDRFGLAAMIGAAIFVIALIEMLIKTQTYRLILACILIGLGTGQNFRFETKYRWSWEKQLKFYWQLKWRAPELVKPTSLFGEGSIASFVGGQMTSSTFNLMYGPVRDTKYMDFRYFDVTKIDPESIIQSRQSHAYSLGYLEYVAPYENNLVFSFEPEKLQCLWVLGEKDRTNPYLTESISEALSLTNLDQILPNTDRSLRSDIFGAEPAHDWCYYYQKGELAGQFENWETVVDLWQEAEQQGKHPRNGIEYATFIEGYAHTGDWDDAVELTRKASFPKYEMRSYLCSTWARISTSTPDSTAKEQTISRVIEDFECQDEFRALQTP